MKDIEKARLGAATLKSFCESWGDDIYSRILLEVLFEGLMNEEALFIFGEQEQTGNQISDNPSIARSDNIKVDGDKST